MLNNKSVRRLYIVVFQLFTQWLHPAHKARNAPYDQVVSLSNVEDKLYRKTGDTLDSLQNYRYIINLNKIFKNSIAAVTPLYLGNTLLE